MFDDAMPSYDEVTAVLRSTCEQGSAAEAHGMLCGFISAGNEMDGKSWLDFVLGELPTSRSVMTKSRDCFLKLYKISSQRLRDMEFDFELLLPESDATLNLRAEALSHWCQGFIIAMEHSGIQVETCISHEAREALRHMFEISKLDYDFIDVSEEDLRAYEEVLEYVRVAVLMVYTEITFEQGGDGGNGSRKLH